MARTVFDGGMYCQMNAEEAREEVDRLVSENERLKAALVKYGCHTSINCYPGGPNGNVVYHCACGLYDFISHEDFNAALERPE